MRDLDIRLALRRQLDARFADDPDTKIIEELGICQGNIRIDIAVANCALHGYEIKSAADTLQRLPAQAEAYSKTFDQVTLVSANKHLEPVLQIVPSWWGLTRAAEHDGTVSLEPLREAKQNPSIDAFSVAQLLWREEALAILQSFGCAKGVKSKTREYVWRRLIQVTLLDELQEIVRTQLKVREGWRVDARQKSGDEKSPLDATSQDYQGSLFSEHAPKSTDLPR